MLFRNFPHNYLPLPSNALLVTRFISKIPSESRISFQTAYCPLKKRKLYKRKEPFKFMINFRMFL
ncbi:hypothetical protein C6837_04900 [Neisseria gonorrhoeae]